MLNTYQSVRAFHLPDFTSTTSCAVAVSSLDVSRANTCKCKYEAERLTFYNLSVILKVTIIVDLPGDLMWPLEEARS